MKPTDSCWECKRLKSKLGAPPPIFCEAFPKGKGIPFAIIAGTVRHDKAIGGEVDGLFFEPKDAEE